MLHDNMLINGNTLKACKVNNIINYIYAGAACSRPHALYASARMGPLQTTAAYSAESPAVYGWVKWLGEYEAELAHSPAFNVGVVRLPSVYGPGSNMTATSSIEYGLHQALSRPGHDLPA